MEHAFSLLVAPGATVHVVLEQVRVDDFEGSNSQVKFQLLKLPLYTVQSQNSRLLTFFRLEFKRQTFKVMIFRLG